MTERTERNLLSRRTACSLFGVTAALSLVVPVTLSALSDAEAQTVGMERRQDRRQGRHERRSDRREGRHERRSDRRTGGTQPATTTGSSSGSSATGSTAGEE
jgi:hypothetical protein